jgi:predicted GIY-YIG superfamily endonuclease
MAEPWFVYIVRCADRTLYTGVTNDTDRRVADHNAGRGARYTRSRLPVDLVYVEPVTDRGAALRREGEIKRMRAAQKRDLIGTGRGT